MSASTIPRQVKFALIYIHDKLYSYNYNFNVILQINYLIDEPHNVGKGAKAIISMLHHFFKHHGFGKSIVHLHADNCTGQNKTDL